MDWRLLPDFLKLNSARKTLNFGKPVKISRKARNLDKLSLKRKQYMRNLYRMTLRKRYSKNDCKNLSLFEKFFKIIRILFLNMGMLFFQTYFINCVYNCHTIIVPAYGVQCLLFWATLYDDQIRVVSICITSKPHHCFGGDNIQYLLF